MQAGFPGQSWGCSVKTICVPRRECTPRRDSMRSLFCTLLFAALTACTSSSSGDDMSGPPGCGDGKLDMGEQCDDGNTNNFDGCLKDCTMVDKLAPDTMAWKYFEIPGTKCLDG